MRDHKESCALEEHDFFGFGDISETREVMLELREIGNQFVDYASPSLVVQRIISARVTGIEHGERANLIQGFVPDASRIAGNLHSSASLL